MKSQLLASQHDLGHGIQLILGWVQLSSCLSRRGPEKASLHPEQLGVGTKTGEAQLGMGCPEEKYRRKLSDVLVVSPSVLGSHNPARLWVAFPDSSGFLHVLFSVRGPAYRSRNNRYPPATARQKERVWLKRLLGQSLTLPGVGLLRT